MSEIRKDELARYLVGESPPDEAERVRRWLEVHPGWRIRLETGRSPADSERRRDPSAVLEKLSSSPRRDRPAVRRKLLRETRAAQAALALFLILAAALVGRGLFRDGGEGRTYATGPGEHLELSLADGSEVELNVASRLEVADAYGRAERYVRLTGQAFFKVAADTSRPFVVETARGRVVVRGTSFDVSAYPGDTHVSVVVAEGLVAVGATDVPAGRRARADGNSVSVETADLESALAWRDGRLVFEATPMIDVAKRLERWYGADVRLEGRIDSLRLDARFTGEPLDEAVRSIAAALALHHEITTDGVLFGPASR